MTIGSTATFDLNAQDVCARALIKVGAIAAGELPMAEMLIHARGSLNILVKALDRDGAFTWRTVRRTVAMISGQASYPLDLDVRNLQPYARYLRPGSTAGNIMWPIGTKEFMQLPDRTQLGVPVQFWGEKAGALVTMQLWPTPNELGTIEYTASLRAKDFTTDANTPDFPPEWLRCLIYGLAADLAPDFGQSPGSPSDPGSLLGIFESERAALIAMDTEQQGLIFTVGGMYGSSY